MDLHIVGTEGMASDSSEKQTNWKMGDYVVDLAHQEVFDLWCSIGIWAGLNSDAQIATFLIQQFEKTHCLQCKTPLSMYCMRCGQDPPQHSSIYSQPQQSSQAQSSDQTVSSAQHAGNVQPTVPIPSGKAMADGADSKSGIASDLDSLAASALSEMKAMDGGTGQIQVTIQQDTLQQGQENASRVASNFAVVKTETCSSSSNSQTHLSEQTATGDRPFFKEPGSSFVAANLANIEQLSRALSLAFGEQSKQSQQRLQPNTVPSLSPPPSQMRLSTSSLAKVSLARALKRKAKITKKKAESMRDSHKKREHREKKEVVKVEKTSEHFDCKICGQSFRGLNVYRKHMKTHGIDKPFECPKCNESFASGGHIKRHTCLKKSDSPVKPTKPFVCNQCGCAYSLKCNLKRHLLIHSGGRQQFICEVCSATFYEKQSLFLHSKTHTTERPYQCSVCGATFRLPSCLNKHSKRHKEEKPYVCTECGFAFRAKDYLRQHMRTHTGERPFVCEICGAGFAQKGSLNSHKKTHKNDV